MAAIYFVFMMGGAFGYRLPPAGWRPQGWTAPAGTTMISARQVHLKDAHKTPQFWLIWAVLCLNVSAGIGVIGMASPMLQEIFGGSLIGRPGCAVHRARRGAERGGRRPSPPASPGCCRCSTSAGGSSGPRCPISIGRKATYYTFFALGIALYASAPWAAHAGSTRCSCSRSASSCRCMAAASRRCRPISPTCSARSSSARSTGGC